MALSFARNRKSDKDLLKKSKSTVKRQAVKGGNNISSRISLIVAQANQKLAHHKDDYITIRDIDTFRKYIEKCKENGICALDTETTGLNPITDKIVGLCLYTPNEKACYVPINHKSYITGVRTKDQLTESDIHDVMAGTEQSVKWIFHNGTFDIRVMRHSCDIDLYPYWDTQLGGNCIDEEESHRLKDLHLKYCDSKDTESLTFDSLFKGITFDNVPIDTATLYAAGDAIKTYELYEYQKTLLNRRVLAGPYNVLTQIEIPIMRVVCDMEDRGVCLDYDFVSYLKEKYHRLEDEANDKIQKVLDMYSEQIENYKLKHPNAKLSDPINTSSPTQLAILFYDILKLESPDSRSPRGTGEDILKHFAKGKEKNLCESILEVRGLKKLLSTYIDKMPEVALSDGRVHARYNQYGAKTGRFSSSDPNLQNIPSHNKEIRKMFKAKDGYVLVGADFSQQEPMVTAHLSQDKKMMDAFIHGKDIYSTIASLAFHKSYEDCLEFRKDGTTNVAGKERRSQAKSIVLGILYGRQIKSIGEQLGVSTQEAQKIYDAVLKAFPMLAKFIEESQNMAKQKGYVTTAWGRRRHLRDMQLDKYEFSYNNNMTSFDPLSFDDDTSTEVPDKVKKQYIKQLDKAYGYMKKRSIIEQARQNGITIKDNSGFIAQAERQCVNARVQGTAADITKLAMIDINNDERMKELDFHLLIQVHDEVIGEVPLENAKEASERLSYLMRTAPTRLIKLPFRCDCDITTNWYGELVEIE